MSLRESKWLVQSKTEYLSNKWMYDKKKKKEWMERLSKSLYSIWGSRVLNHEMWKHLLLNYPALGFGLWRVEWEGEKWRQCGKKWWPMAFLPQTKTGRLESWPGFERGRRGCQKERTEGLAKTFLQWIHVGLKWSFSFFSFLYYTPPVPSFHLSGTAYSFFWFIAHPSSAGLYFFSDFSKNGYVLLF